MPGKVIAALPCCDLGHVFRIKECGRADRQANAVRDNRPLGREPVEHLWDRLQWQEARPRSWPAIHTKYVRHDRDEVDAIEVGLYEPVQRSVIQQADTKPGQV